jgi:hypothetical protein
MDATNFIITLLIITISIFVLSHLRPLNISEIRSLANKRRKKDIKNYYYFPRKEMQPNIGFKKKMNPNGAFYRVNETLTLFPSIAASLLKYKKHEWSIIAFERNKTVDLIWVNKGSDNKSVPILLTVEQIIDISRNQNYTTVLKFHNHPNSNPRYYDCTRPSDQDLKTAKFFGDTLNQFGINIISFVCERGIHYKYDSSIADSFCPISTYINSISMINNSSRIANLSLHLERIFS